MGDCDRRLFHGLSAWFSSSVRGRRRQLWENGGGELTPFDEAQFLFSENAESEDTKKIFESEAYLQEHLAVFHSLYIDRCRELGNRADVKLGDYFLPPSDIQAMVKKQMRYKWELDQPDSDDDSSAPNTDHQHHQEETQTMETQADRDVAPEELPSTSADEGFVDVKDLPKYTGLLTEFLPGKEGFEVISVR